MKMPELASEDLSSLISDMNTRLRVLESKYPLFGERVLVINKNMIMEYKKLMAEIKAIDKELMELKKEAFALKETVTGIVKDLSLFARKDQLKILEKYINLWNPLNFITEKEALELIKKGRGKNSG